MGTETIDSNQIAAATMAEATQAIVKEFAFFEGLLNTGIAYVQTYAWQIVAAIIILIIGLVISNWVQKIIVKAGTKQGKIDPTLLGFLAGFTRLVIVAFTVMIMLSKLGITIAPLIAALSAGIFGATFAIQAPIANYAAGLSIILSRPFKLGDFITLKELSGRVEEITLAMTFLRNCEGELVQIPNKRIIGEVIENSMDKRVVNGIVSISYSAEPEIAIDRLRLVLTNLELVNRDIPVRVGIHGFGDSGIEIEYRCMVPVDSYLEMKYMINKEVFIVLQELGIEIPFPQRVVTLRQ